jgi:hypothetical protein
MKALTLHQPYATLVAVGAKRIETRGWRTRYRGPLAIHAARSFSPEMRALCLREPFRTVLQQAGYTDLDSLPLGAVVATCYLMDCLPTGPDTATPPHDLPLKDSAEWAFGNYAPGRWQWLLEDVRPLQPPQPVRGKQGLWEWSDGAEQWR